MDLEFEVNELVSLKVSPLPEGCYESLYEGEAQSLVYWFYNISKSIGNVAYELGLPKEFAVIHPVFHNSWWKECIGDTSHITLTEAIWIKDSLSYEEVLFRIYITKFTSLEPRV